MWENVMNASDITAEQKLAIARGFKMDDDSHFVQSCLKFLFSRRFLSQKQISALQKTEGKYTRKFNRLNLY